MFMFLSLGIVGLLLSQLQLTYVLNELMMRFARNSFIILALLLPIVAGMGINFAITIGAMAAQISIMLVLNWKIPGMWGILAAAAMTAPLAGIFGYLIGQLLNRMKGQEMIGSMILGYFANGLYQLLFLFVFGHIIPISNKDLIIKGGTGISNTMDLSVPYGIKNALNNLWRLPFAEALYVFTGAVAVLMLVLYFWKKRPLAKCVVPVALLAVCCAALQIPAVAKVFALIRVSMSTMVAIGLLGTINMVIMRTRLGQRFRAVGHNQAVANAAGINVNRTRIIAIVLSTIFAGWGQIIYLQSLGTITTYSAHEQVGLYAGAAILVGGATLSRATNGQALLGCVLFHLLFVVAPKAGANLLGDPAIGEYFRVFISYGVIALALVMHAWKNAKKSKPGAALAR